MLRIGSFVWRVRDVPRAIVFPKDRAGPQLPIKLVSSQAETHRRHHLDLYASDRTAEVERLVGLGAVRVDWRYEPDADYVVLADPDGNRFCVVQKPD